MRDKGKIWYRVEEFNRMKALAGSWLPITSTLTEDFSEARKSYFRFKKMSDSEVRLMTSEGNKWKLIEVNEDL